MSQGITFSDTANQIIKHNDISETNLPLWLISDYWPKLSDYAPEIKIYISVIFAM
jgi:hypothetical protein